MVRALYRDSGQAHAHVVLWRWCAPLSTRLNKPKARWLKPEVMLEVEYRALTGEGKLRHPSFKGIREDLS